jgi:hypothetical protein
MNKLIRTIILAGLAGTFIALKIILAPAFFVLRSAK